MLFKEKTLVSNFIENFFWNRGFQKIAGIDEAGRGSIAGPLFVALVVFPPGYQNSEIKDSKLLTPQKREKLYEIICREALFYKISYSTVEEINTLGLKAALFLAFNRILESKPWVDLLLIDGYIEIPNYYGLQKSFVKGDRLSLSIAGASILAKVARDRYMVELAKLYPEYKFEKHKGYGTAEHFEIIKKLGPSPHHRILYKCFKEK